MESPFREGDNLHGSRDCGNFHLQNVSQDPVLVSGGQAKNAGQPGRNQHHTNRTLLQRSPRQHLEQLRRTDDQRGAQGPEP